jgi:hypothetical protein
MVQKRPRVSSDTLEQIATLVEPLGVDAQEATVDHQLRALLEAYAEVIRRNRELDRRLRAFESSIGGSADGSDVISFSSGSAEAAADESSSVTADWHDGEYEEPDDDPPGRTTHLR